MKRHPPLNEAQQCAVVEALPRLERLASQLDQSFPRLGRERILAVLNEELSIHATRWEPARGPLYAYARRGLKGAVVDEAAVTGMTAERRAAREFGLDAMEQFTGSADPFASDAESFELLAAACEEVAFGMNAPLLSSAIRAARDDDPERRAARLQFHAALREAGARLLGPKELRLVELRYVEDRRWPDVADELGMSESSAKRMDRHVREALREDLEGAGYRAGDLSG